MRGGEGKGGREGREGRGGREEGSEGWSEGRSMHVIQINVDTKVASIVNQWI